MAVSVNQVQRREEKDPLDTILKGLSIAQGIYGIKDAGAKAEQLKAQTELQKQQAENQSMLAQKQMAQIDRQEKGIVTAGELLGKAGQIQEARAGAEGASPYQVLGQNGVVETRYFAPVKQKDPEASGLASLIKQQQAILQGQQIKEHEKKAGEIEGPKAQAATYGRRMEQADKIMADLASEGYDRASIRSGLDSSLPGAVQLETTKRQEQAERNFINALLRRESGAAIAKDEYASAEMQYFDRVGDSDEVKAQKAQNRAQAIAGLRAEAGHAWDKIPLQETKVAGGKNPLKGSGLLLNSANAATGGGEAFDPIAYAQEKLVKQNGMAGKLPKK